MKFLKQFIFIFLLWTVTTMAFPSGNMFLGSSLDTIPTQNIETISVTVNINGISYAQMNNLPKTGYLEIYSIIGKRVKAVDLKNTETSIYVELPNGLYILKAGRITQKVIVK